jgi:hypothetical protein
MFNSYVVGVKGPKTALCGGVVRSPFYRSDGGGEG